MYKQFKDKLRSPVVHLMFYMLIARICLPILDIRRTKPIGTIFREMVLYAPTIISAILVVIFLFFVIFRKTIVKNVTLHRIIFVVIGLLMFTLAIHLSDFYMTTGARYIICNAHFINYALYTVLLYRVLSIRKINTVRIITLTYISGLVLAIIDEILQTLPKLSPGIFDISDIAKDGWGMLVTFFLIFFVAKEGLFSTKESRRVLQPRLKDYFQKPYPLLVLLFIFNLLLLIFSSLLTSLSYFYVLLLLTFFVFIVVFFILHMSQYKFARIIFSAIIIVSILTQSFFFIKYKKENILYNIYGLTIYKGIPILLFDVLIYPSGFFRLVDKKHRFNHTDKARLLSLKSDLIIIGSGSDGIGGKGFFPDNKGGHNKGECILDLGSGISSRVVILRTPAACKLFNKIKKQNNKQVTFVIHNTC